MLAFLIQISFVLLCCVVGTHCEPGDVLPQRERDIQRLLIQENAPKRVAIIGAGSAGSSVAYYLSQFATRAHDVTIFERQGYVGGRSTTVNVYDDPLQPVELGASIFVEVNRNLVSAAKAFNLSTGSFGGSQRSTQRSADADASAVEDSARLGIWNGDEFVLIQTLSGSRWQSWWSNAKLLWRYGTAPFKAYRVMQTVVGRFLKMYDTPHFPFKSLSQVVYDVGLTAVTAATGEQYLAENEITKLFADEVVQASTRVNYAQNINRIHGLETMVCLATDGAMSVEGGNWRIFDSMIKYSGAALKLNTTVSAVSKNFTDSTFKVTSEQTQGMNAGLESTSSSDVFDEVVVAAPFHQTAIKFDSPIEETPDDIAYVQLHVTLFTSPLRISPRRFNLAPDEDVPQVILTTLQPDECPVSDADRAGRAGFFSISLLRSVANPKSGTEEFLYKVFSPESLDDRFFATIFGLDPDNAEIGPSVVSWVYRKLWQSYPFLPPRVTFEELQLDQGLWYSSGIESLISTMETSSLMGMNIAKLIADEWTAVA